MEFEAFVQTFAHEIQLGAVDVGQALRIDPLQATGSRALGRLALRAAIPEMDYYERFKKEIDGAAAI